MGLLDGFSKLVGGAEHAVGNAAHTAGQVGITALHDIPLISRGIQQAMKGQVSPGADLVHAREFQGDPYGKGYYISPFGGDNTVVPYDNSPRPVTPPNPALLNQINQATGFSLPKLSPAANYQEWNAPVQEDNFVAGSNPMFMRLQGGRAATVNMTPDYTNGGYGLMAGKINQATGFNPTLRPPQPFNQPLVDGINRATGFGNGIDPSIFGYGADKTSRSPFQR